MTRGDKGKKARVLSGMRPTGRLHIGHYFGALQNWVRLQNDPAYDCFYFIADWHALTSDYADTSAVAENTLQIMIDYLAAGLDPAKSVIFQQSLVPEHAELHLLLSMLTPLGWLEREPTYNEALKNITDKDLHMYGFLGYPVLQCADIVIYSKQGVPLYVPVGEDQKSHVELSGEIVRKFNLHNVVLDVDELLRPENRMAMVVLEGSFGGKSGFGQVPTARKESVHELERLIRRRVAEVGVENYLQQLQKSYDRKKDSDIYHNEIRGFASFKESHNVFRKFVKETLCEPEVLLTQTPRIPGTDGRKMSKSYNNFISLSASDDIIWKKVRPMKTDPARMRRENPGNPDICPVYDWHKLFAPKNPEGQATLDWAAQGCRTAGIGCIECKQAMTVNLVKWIAPIRRKRLEYEADEMLVRRLIQKGSAEARAVAQQTMRRVRDAVFGKDRIPRPRLWPPKMEKKKKAGQG